MDIHEFATIVQDQTSSLDEQALVEFETLIGAQLPDQYREFLLICNGGRVGGAYFTREGEFRSEKSLWYDENVGVDVVGGLRNETYYSLEYHRARYQSGHPARIPRELLWIMSDPFGNEICLGIRKPYRGKVYFWDHEQEPDPDHWDGAVESSDNLFHLANIFYGFVAGLSWEPESNTRNMVERIDWQGFGTSLDGRSFVSAHGILLDSSYIRIDLELEKEIPAAAIESILSRATSSDFPLDALKIAANGYGILMASEKIYINPDYVKLLQQLPYKQTARICANTSTDPLILCDGDDVIGAVMPKK